MTNQAEQGVGSSEGYELGASALCVLYLALWAVVT